MSETRGPGREPYARVRKELSVEVGFRCPVAECGLPYLTWHHFDPPWRIEHHHRPEGMIALCRRHADEADNGTFSDDQLREMKRNGAGYAKGVSGRFNWMRQKILAVVGGNFYYDQDVIFQINEARCIWFERSETDDLLLNFQMPSLSGQRRASIENNFWTVVPKVGQIICPPSGRIVEVKYENGDRFRVEFVNVLDREALAKRYLTANVQRWVGDIKVPVTVAEIAEKVAGTSIEFGAGETKLPGIVMTGGFFTRNGIAIGLQLSDADYSRLFAEQGQ